MSILFYKVIGYKPKTQKDMSPKFSKLVKDGEEFINVCLSRFNLEIPQGDLFSLLIMISTLIALPNINKRAMAL